MYAEPVGVDLLNRGWMSRSCTTQIAMDPNRLDHWMAACLRWTPQNLVAASKGNRAEIWMRPTTRSMASRQGRFFHGYYSHYCFFKPAVHLLRRRPQLCARVAVFQYRWGPLLYRSIQLEPIP